MKSRLALVLLLLPAAGCISLETYNRKMRECQKKGEQFADLEKENADLKKQLEAKSAEVAEARNAYDELSQELKEEIARGDVGLTKTDAGVTITVENRVLFASGQWELQPNGHRIIANVSRVLKNLKDQDIHVEGHSDNVAISGTLKNRFLSNWDLSAARAAAVVRTLQQYGVPTTNIVLTAYGETRPVASNDTPEGRAQNRRVEINLVPKENHVEDTR
jgi:chemotaxis protein MotB